MKCNMTLHDKCKGSNIPNQKGIKFLAVLNILRFLTKLTVYKPLAKFLSRSRSVSCIQ